MENAMKWINEKLAPPLYKITGNRWIASILNGFMKYMPLLLVGAVLQLVVNLSSLFAADYSALIEVMSDLTFGIFSVCLAYTIAHSIAQQHEINPVTAGLFSIATFLILIRPVFSEDGMFQVELARLGVQGIFVAIVAALFTGEVVGQFQKRKWTMGTEGLPDFVKDWFTPLLPGLIVVFIAWLVAYVLNFDLYASVAKLIVPLLSTADTFPAFLGIAFFLTALFVIGINGGITFGILFPLWFAAVGENAALYAQGLQPTHINTIQTLTGFIVLGGTGATLTLCIMMLWSKSVTMKSLAKAAIVPSIMNINEPLIFGLPIAFNPIMAIPFILNGGIINPTLTYLAMSTGLVSKPINPALLAWVPAPIPAFIYTQDFRSIILVFVLLCINAVVWYPFFKSYEKTMIAKENSAK